MKCVAYQNGVSIGDVTIEDISEVLKQEHTFVWLGLREANAALLAEIQQEFGLHDLAIEDACAAHQRLDIHFGARTARRDANPFIGQVFHVFGVALRGVGPFHLRADREGVDIILYQWADHHQIVPFCDSLKHDVHGTDDQIYAAGSRSLLGQWPICQHDGLTIQPLFLTEALFSHDPVGQVQDGAWVFLIPDDLSVGMGGDGNQSAAKSQRG